jgi:hypothetical protein
MPAAQTSSNVPGDLAQVRAYADALVGTIREFCDPGTALVPPSGS